MNQQILNNEELLGVIRSKVNGNFEELYSLILELSGKLGGNIYPTPVPTDTPSPSPTPSPTPVVPNDPITQLGEDIIGEQDGDFFGCSVDINAEGNVIVVGAMFNDGAGSNAGQATVFEFGESGWAQKGQNIIGEASGDFLGISVAINRDGNRIIVGSPYNDNPQANNGVAKVYEFDGAEWIQLGQNIHGEAQDDRLTYVSINGEGNIISVGASQADGSNGDLDAGNVKIYSFDGSQWNQLGQTLEGNFLHAHFAISCLNVSGDVVSIFTENAGGYGEVYGFDGSQWNLIGQPINDTLLGGLSFDTMTLSKNGQILAVGCYADGGDFILRSFTFDGAEWTQNGQDLVYGTKYVSRFQLNEEGNVLAISSSDSNLTTNVVLEIYHFDGSQWNHFASKIISEQGDVFIGSLALNSGGLVSDNTQRIVCGIRAVQGLQTQPGVVRAFSFPLFIID